MKICIDPGHGGYDPGAVNHNVGVTEKALALKIAALLGGELASRGFLPGTDLSILSAQWPPDVRTLWTLHNTTFQSPALPDLLQR